MTDTPDRIEQAWRRCRSWITEFTGAPIETYLRGAPEAGLPGALQALAGQSPDLRLMAILGEETEASSPVGPDAAEVTLARLKAGVIAGLDANFTAHLEGFDLAIHLVVHPDGLQALDLELIWWGDEAFPDGSDYRLRFRQVAAYLVDLQGLFKAQEILIGPEADEPPGPRADGWVRL